MGISPPLPLPYHPCPPRLLLYTTNCSICIALPVDNSKIAPLIVKKNQHGEDPEKAKVRRYGGASCQKGAQAGANTSATIAKRTERPPEACWRTPGGFGEGEGSAP